MSVSNFNTPSPIAVALDLYVADVRFAVSDRTDTIVDVRPSDPDKGADVKAAEHTRVEYDDVTRTLSIVSRKPATGSSTSAASAQSRSKSSSSCPPTLTSAARPVSATFRPTARSAPSRSRPTSAPSGSPRPGR